MDNIQQIILDAQKEIEQVSSKAVLTQIRARYLGKQSPFNSLLSQLKSLPTAES